MSNILATLKTPGNSGGIILAIVDTIISILSHYMLLYFEFEEKRRKAEVTWPKNDENIIVHITDPELAANLPTDLYYEVEDGNKVTFTIESQNDVRLLELQTVIKRRLQEFVTKS